MSTAELKEIIDRRTPEERKWMTAYLLDEMFSVPELHQTAQELSELARRRGDLLAVELESRKNPLKRTGTHSTSKVE
jgi:hypothetical protein